MTNMSPSFEIPPRKRCVRGAPVRCDGKVILWDLAAGGPISSTPAYEGTVDCLAYSNDGKMFASAAGDSVVQLWNAETGALMAHTEEHSGIIMTLAFSPDNERFVSACAEG